MSKQNLILNITGILLALIFLIMHIHILRKSDIYKRLIKSPRSGLSYCIITVWIIDSLKAFMWISILLLVYRIGFIAILDKFVDWIFFK